MSKIKMKKLKKPIKEANDDFDLDALDTQFDDIDGADVTNQAIIDAKRAAQKDVEREKKLNKPPKRKRGELRPDDEDMLTRWDKLYTGMSDEEIGQIEKTLNAIEADSAGKSSITINDAFLKESTKRTFVANLMRSKEFSAEEKYILCLLMGIPLTWVNGSEVPLEIIGKIIGVTKPGVLAICDRAIKKLQAKAGMKNPTGMKAFKGMKIGKPTDMPDL